MTPAKQKEAFDRELHALIDRYFDEFDISAEDMLEILVREEMFLICMAIQCTIEEDDEDMEDWKLNGEEYE